MQKLRGLGCTGVSARQQTGQNGSTETTRSFCPLCLAKLRGFFFSTKVVVCMFSLCCSLSVNSILVLRESFLALVK